MPNITVIHAGESRQWIPIPQEDTDDRPVAEETIEHRSADGRFAVGFWRRGPEEGPMELTEFHETMFIIEGTLEITPENGEAITVGPGDLVIAPQGSRGTWKAITPVRKVWSIYRDPTTT